jgi:hypothetical protein
MSTDGGNGTSPGAQMSQMVRTILKDRICLRDGILRRRSVWMAGE